MFTVGGNDKVNANNQTYVAYLFAHETNADSMIQCGGYTGTGSNGNFVSLGWEPQWVMVKRTDSAGAWEIQDSMRGIVEGQLTMLEANSSAAEVDAATANCLSLTATGFNVNGAGGSNNANGGTYVYMAIRAPMMIAPTDATEVFAPNFYGTSGYVGYLGAPADMHMLGYRNGNSQNAITSSRLIQGNKALVTSSSAAEITSNSSWDNMSGVTPVGTTLSTLISWTWKRAKGFMDVVAYTGTGSPNVHAPTLSHSLGVPPEMVWVKKRSSTSNWAVVSQVGTGGVQAYLDLNNGNVGTLATTGPSNVWSDYFTATQVIGNGGGGAFSSAFPVTSLNATGNTYIMYLFATLAGVSKVGSYTGTGADLNVDCGFSAGARFILIKRYDSTGDWYTWDSARGISAGNDPYMALNSASAEVTGTDYVDSLNVGFTVTSSAPAGLNANGGTYIFYAIA